MPKPTKVAVCQMTSTEFKDINLKTVEKLVKEANRLSAKFVFLPESCDFIATPMINIKKLAEKIDGPLMLAYRNLAKENNIWISVGSFHELTKASRVYKTQVIIDSNGNIRATYRKLHLSERYIGNIAMDESRDITAGKHLTQTVEVVSTPVGSLGLLIGHDIRFPAVSTILQSASVITYPSAFTKVTGEAHWEVLVRTRAIENKCNVVAAAQVGIHNCETCSYGQSMIVDHMGNVLAECPKCTEGYIECGTVAVAVIKPSRSAMTTTSYVYRLELNKSIVYPDSHKLGAFMFSDQIIPRCMVFYQTKYCFAFSYMRCVVPGHVLVATKRVVPQMKCLTPKEIADTFQTSVQIQTLMERIHKTNSSTMVVQDGEDADQTVPHVHVHILPRKSGDLAVNDNIYKILAKHDKEGSHVRVREVADMAAEAAKLRALLNDHSAELSED